MSIDGTAAIKTLRGFAPLAKHGHCLEYVWLAYRAHGAVSAQSYPTAYAAARITKRRHTDRTPPAGVPVWLGQRASDGEMSGDVCISIGAGRVIATDQPTWGTVGTCTIAEREKLTGRPFMFWSEDFLGNTVYTEEETDMPITKADAALIARTILEWRSPGLEDSSGGTIPRETIARRLRVLRAHTNHMPARIATLEAQNAALAVAVSKLAAGQGVDAGDIKAAIDKALSAWSLTLSKDEPAK